MGKNVKRRLKLGPADFMLTTIVMALVVFGVMMVFSASYYYALDRYDDPYYFLIRDAIYALIGLVIMFLASIFEYRNLKYFSKAVLIVSLVLLVIVLIIGRTSGGATRWIDMGFFNLMPGEIAKPALILFAADFLSRKPGRIKNFIDGVLPMVALIVAFFFLVLFQPNTSTAVIIAAIAVAIMFVAGLSWMFLGIVGGAGVAGIIAIILSDPDGYRMRRIMSFMDPFSDPQNTGYQVVQSLLAMGSGGVFGVGIGKSIQKTLYLPEPHNDFILAVIGEELGLVGITLLMLAYMVLIWRCVKISLGAPDMFGLLLGSGITAMLAIQVIMNVAVVTSSMPPTGVTLPFVSWGGNSLIIFMGCMGIMMNISRHGKKKKKKKADNVL